jgi:hypothetical protein
MGAGAVNAELPGMLAGSADMLIGVFSGGAPGGKGPAVEESDMIRFSKLTIEAAPRTSRRPARRR